MTHDETIEMRMRNSFCARPWTGVVPVEEAIEGCIEYRQGLSEGDRALYDEAILDGFHPFNACELIEYDSRRSNLSERRRSHVETNAS